MVSQCISCREQKPQAKWQHKIYMYVKSLVAYFNAVTRRLLKTSYMQHTYNTLASSFKYGHIHTCMCVQTTCTYTCMYMYMYVIVLIHVLKILHRYMYIRVITCIIATQRIIHVHVCINTCSLCVCSTWLYVHTLYMYITITQCCHLIMTWRLHTVFEANTKRVLYRTATMCKKLHTGRVTAMSHTCTCTYQRPQNIVNIQM